MNAVRQPKRHQRIGQARRLRREMTEPERRLWQNLRNLRVGPLHFRKQAPIGRYFADFACHQKRVAIEVDGESHTKQAAAEHDAARSEYFRSQGYRVLHFWNNDAMNNIEGVMTIIHEALSERAAQEPPPLTPPRAARGRGTP